jgi:hypothetical protein
MTTTNNTRHDVHETNFVNTRNNTRPNRTSWPLHGIAIVLALAIGCTPTSTAPAPPSDHPPADVDNQQTATPAADPAEPLVAYPIDYSRKTLAAFATSAAATGDEWHLNILGPRVTLFIREPITLATADRLIDAWDRPGHRLLTRDQDLELHRCIHAIVSETVADFATANQTDKTRAHRLGPWLIELRLCTDYRDIPGTPSFATLIIEHPSDTMTARLKPQPIPPASVP